MDQLLKSKYRIGQKLAENPFSVTYQGFFIGTDKPVIVKIYKRGTLNSTLIKSMKQRVLGFSIVNHQGLTKLYDGDYGWQGFYYVREYVDGPSLADLLAQGEKFDAAKATVIIEQALAALAAAHARGVVHGSLKPTNIFIDRQGIVKLTDFVVEGELKAALPQKILELMANGRYASPEELAGLPVTPATDLFALGLVLYELLTGRPAVTELGLGGGVRKLRGPVKLPPETAASWPLYLREIVTCALRPDPLQRFASADEFRAALEGRRLPRRGAADDELVKIFESVVTQYGGEELDSRSEVLEEVGQIKLRWGKEKHRNWILAVVTLSFVVLGIIYAYFLGR
ncbi:MAG: serine/threonine-protein kinase [Candidatus Margulisiibacteriota bacterium]